MEDDRVWYSENVPADIPTRDNIVASCALAGWYRKGAYVKPRFWVKYGDRSIIRGEGRTQAHVARIVNDNTESLVRVPEVYLGFSRGSYGYIVMDFVRGSTPAQRKSEGYYKKEDIEAVAAAVQQLASITAPVGTPPGPVGGGLIRTYFFDECISAIRYATVEELETQTNNVLRRCTNGLRVDFQTETANGLVLCPSEPYDSKFIIDDKGKLWVVDFELTCFLPPSFVSYSLSSSLDGFVRHVARCINYPPSANLNGMSMAAGQFIIFGDNALGTKAAWRPPGSARPSNPRRGKNP